jgi:hypothetical protein
MAKVKKQESTEKKEPAAKKKASSAPSASKKASKPVAPAGTPMVDTTLAAQAAASMISNRAALGEAQAPSTGGGAEAQPKAPESSAFKAMKESLNKPSGQFSNSLLGNANNKKKSNMPFGGGKQVGHNQTFGADVNRAGVPRRTPG